MSSSTLFQPGNTSIIAHSTSDLGEQRPNKKQKVVEVASEILFTSANDPCSSAISSSSVSQNLYQPERYFDTPTFSIILPISKSDHPLLFLQAIDHLKNENCEMALGRIANDSNLGRVYLIYTIGSAMLLQKSPSDEYFKFFENSNSALKCYLHLIPDLEWKRFAQDISLINDFKKILKLFQIQISKEKDLNQKTKQLSPSSKLSSQEKHSSATKTVEKTSDQHSEITIESVDFSPALYQIIFCLHEKKIGEAEDVLKAWKKAEKQNGFVKIQMRFLKALIICLNNQNADQIDFERLIKAKKLLKKTLRELKPYPASNLKVTFLKIQSELMKNYIKAFNIEFSSVSINFNTIVNNFIILKNEKKTAVKRAYVVLRSAMAKVKKSEYKEALENLDECIRLSEPEYKKQSEVSICLYRAYLVKAAVLFKLSRKEKSEDYLKQAQDICPLIEFCEDFVSEHKKQELAKTKEYLLNLANEPITKAMRITGLFDSFY